MKYNSYEKDRNKEETLCIYTLTMQATTKTSQAAIDAMVDIMNNVYGNPSSLHTVGQKA